MSKRNNDNSFLMTSIPKKMVGGFFSSLGNVIGTVIFGGLVVGGAAWWSTFRQLPLWIQIMLGVCLLLLIIVIILCYQLYVCTKILKDKDRDSGRLSSIEKAQWAHSVLIIDDEGGFLEKIENHLKGKIEPHKMHLVCIKEIPDY